MESFKPQPFEERKSQKLNFLDYAKEKLFWVVLPFATAGAAMLFGKATKFKIWPLDGSPDLVTTLYAKATKALSSKHNLEGGKDIEKWLNNGAWFGDVIESFGGASKERLRKYYFNAVKGLEVATPFSAYFLWNKKEGNRLDLEDAGDKLKSVQTLKPTDAELSERNEVLRRELAFAAGASPAPPSMPVPSDRVKPPAMIDLSSAEHQGKLAEQQQQQQM